jgi:hypothetical protein
MVTQTPRLFSERTAKDLPQVLLDDKKRKIKHVQGNYKPESFHQATCLPLFPTNNYKDTKNDSLKIKVITALQLVG